MTQELRPYTPTWNEQIISGLTGLLGGGRQAQSFSEGLLGDHPMLGFGLLDMVPPLAFQEAAATGQGPLMATAAMLPIPAFKAARPAMRAGAELLELDAKNAAISAARPNDARFPGAGPDRSHVSLVRHRAPKGDSSRFQSLEQRIETNPQAKDEMMQLAIDGSEIGRRWYNTEALRDRFVKELGDKEGDKAWREYIWLVGATSTGSKVPQNIRNASHYFVANSQQDLAKIADDLMSGNYKPPKGYGHKMQKNQAANVGRAVTGKWDPATAPGNLNPKPRGFLQSLLGSESNIAADKHFMRLMGMMSDDPAFLHNSAEISDELVKELRAKYGKKLDKYISRNEFTSDTGVKGVRTNFNAKKAVREGPADLYDTIKGKAAVWDDMPNDNEYAAFERIANKMARELNMTGAQFQASLWMGAAKKTGVDPSSLDTFENLFENRLREAGAERGLTPDEVFRRFATRKEALAVPLGLLGVPTVLQGGGLLNQQD